MVNNNRKDNRFTWGLVKLKKKVVCGIIVITLLFAGGMYVVNAESLNLQSSIEQKLIRFHVIANSDSVQDQAVKLKVRDKVLEYISPKLKNSKSKEESEKILREHDKEIIKISENTLKENGYQYTVTTRIGKENFPVKVYGNITLPQGEYDAYKIIIGSGQGKNWWCVMFPPLCFVDITKGEVSYRENEKRMKQVLSENEYNAVDNTRKKDEIKIRFKLADIIKNISKRIQ